MFINILRKWKLDEDHMVKYIRLDLITQFSIMMAVKISTLVKFVIFYVYFIPFVQFLPKTFTVAIDIR